MSESVKETIDRVMQQAGYYDHPYQVGERTFYVDGDSPFAQNGTGNNAGLNNMQRYNQETLNNTASMNGQDYQLKAANTYAWDVPDKYDHRDNISATWNNFKIINQEHPIEKPISTGNNILDKYLLGRLGQTFPFAASLVNAFNYGYLGAGYYDNWQRAKEVKNTPEMKYFSETNKTYLKSR